MKKSLFLFISLFFISGIVFSQNTGIDFFKNFSPKFYVCYKSPTPINIDGKIDEDSWGKTKWTDDFADIEGSVKPLPRLGTRAKMLWDDKYLYIAAELEETDIWAKLKQYDTVIFYDNDFEVFIDPDGDTHQYYEFEMNAFNTVWELLLVKPYRDDGPAINAWDIKGLKTAVNINGTINKPGDKDKNWTIEIAFPWEVLKECANKNAPPKSGDQWRINFSRVEWRTEVKDGGYKKVINPETGKPYPEDNWVWSPQGVINMHCPETWGFLQFSEKAAGSGEDKYVYNIEENAKWALRQIYYKEKSYFEKNKKYTADLNELNIKGSNFDGYIWPPVIQCTESQFESLINKNDKSHRWFINQEGRTWRIQP